MDASLLTACRYAMPFGLDVPNRLTEAVVTADAEELSLETFRHNGIIFEVIQQAPDFAAVTRGTWLQLCYDPYDSKDDKVGEVISCEGRLRDYRIVLALDGDPQQECVLDSTDGAFAIIKKVGADRVPVSPAEPFARPAPGPSALRPTQVISNGREPPAVRRTGKRPAELNNGGGDIIVARSASHSRRHRIASSIGRRTSNTRKAVQRFCYHGGQLLPKGLRAIFNIP